MRKELFPPFFFLIVLGFVAFSLQPLWAAESTTSRCSSCVSFGIQGFPEKREAPPFALRTLDGRTLTLNQYKGKPLLLFFWTTWCEACKEDIVLVEKFAQRAKDQITILTLVVDGERERKTRQIVSKLKITLPVLLICKENVIDPYEIRMVPCMIFINPEGYLMGKAVGQRDWTKPEAWSVAKELFGLN